MRNLFTSLRKQVLVLCGLLCLSVYGYSATYTAKTTATNWNLAASWTRTGGGTGFPVAGDFATIPVNSTVTVPSSTSSACANLTLAGSGAVVVSGNLEVLGTSTQGLITMNSSGTRSTVTINGTGFVKCSNITGGSLSMSSTSTLDLYSASTKAISFPTNISVLSNFGILKINTTVTNAAAYVLTALIIGDENGNASLSENNNSVSFTGSLATNYLIMYPNTYFTIYSTSPFFFRENDDLMAGSTIEFNTQAAKTITVDSIHSFQNLVLSGTTGIKTIDATGPNLPIPFKVLGNLDISCGVNYTSNIDSIILGGNFFASTPNTLSPGSKPVLIAGDWNSNVPENLVGPVTYNGAVDQIVGPNTYTKVSFINGGIKNIFGDTHIETTGTVTVGASTTLAVNNTAGGRLTLLSNGVKSANIDFLPADAFVTGNIDVQSYFTGGSLATRGTRTVSSPIVEMASPNNIYKQIQKYVVVTGPGGVTNGFDAGGASQPEAVTLTKYNESATSSQSQFTPVASINEAATPGKGFFLFYRGDRTDYDNIVDPVNNSGKVNRKNGNYDIPENTILTYVGVINQQAVPYTLSYTNTGDAAYDGYNLVGNPYPATIEFATLKTNNSSIFDEFIIPRSGDAYYTYKNGVSADGTNRTVIQTGQGFYVRTNTNGSSLGFTEGVKSVASFPPRVLFAPEKQIKLATTKGSLVGSTSTTPHKVLRMALTDGAYTDYAAVVFEEGNSATAGFEDAAYFSGTPTVSLNTMSSDNKRLAINFMPALPAVSSLKLNFSTAASGISAEKLTFTDLAGVGSYNIALYDAYTNQTIDVKANPIYNFTLNSTVPQTYGADRFTLAFTPPTVLPVKLIDFTAKKDVNGVKLNWKTASESNSSYFEVQRSTDGQSFSALEKVNAAGNSTITLTYNLLDKTPLAGTSYYRLKQVDTDGNLFYSSPVSVEYALSALALVAYPNPVKDFLQINNSDKLNEDIIASIYDLQGKKYTTNNFTKGQLVKVNTTSLTKGVYFIKLESKSGKVKKDFKFIK